MDFKLNSGRIILVLFVVNLSGAALRYFNFDTFFFLLGFRFHISFLLPFILLFNKEQIPLITELFRNPVYKKNFIFIFWLIFPLLIISIVYYFFFNLDINDPDYFYEFGLSSIVDYPVYLIWNLPQLFMLIIILTLFSEKRNKIFIVFLIIFSLFLFEFIPFKEKELSLSEINFINITAFIFAGLILSVLINYYRNIYWNAVFLFTFFWIYLLLFGSDSAVLVKLLFASQYENWGGFLSADEIISKYLLAVPGCLTFIVVLFSLFFRKEKI